MVLKFSKKADLTSQELVGWIIVLALVIVAILFIANPTLIDKIKNLPGYSAPADSFSELSCDVVKQLNYNPVAKVVYEQRDCGVFRDGVKHYYIDFQTKIPLKESSCPAGSVKFICMVDDCPHSEIAQKDCSGAGKVPLNGCFDSGGSLRYETTNVNTCLFIDWTSGEDGSGDLMLSRALYKGGNVKLGTFKNYFFKIDQTAYSSIKDYLIAQGVTLNLIENLNGAKYVSGNIYRSKDKPLGFAALAEYEKSLQPIDQEQLNLEAALDTPLKTSYGPLVAGQDTYGDLLNLAYTQYDADLDKFILSTFKNLFDPVYGSNKWAINVCFPSAGKHSGTCWLYFNLQMWQAAIKGTDGNLKKEVATNLNTEEGDIIVNLRIFK